MGEPVEAAVETKKKRNSFIDRLKESKISIRGLGGKATTKGWLLIQRGTVKEQDNPIHGKAVFTAETAEGVPIDPREKTISAIQHKWEKLYFVLDDNGLRGYEAEVKDLSKPGEVKEVVTFSAASAVANLGETNFEVWADKMVALRATNKKERESWEKALQKHIKALK